MSENKHPPKWVLSFFRWFCHPEYQEDMEGDLLERFETSVDANGIQHARKALILDVIKLFRPSLMKPFSTMQNLNNIGMYQHHLKIAFRLAFKQKVYTAINLFGLAVGIACFAIIILYVYDELSYDQFHMDADRIHRIVYDQVGENGFIRQRNAAPGLAAHRKSVAGRSIERVLNAFDDLIQFRTTRAGRIAYGDIVHARRPEGRRFPGLRRNRP